MVIGLLDLEIFLPYSHSLKDKRKRLKGLRDRLRLRYNVAFAELDFQDKWQRAQMGIVTINRSQEVIAKTFQSILKDVDHHIEGEIIRSRIEYF
jgi:uncharacterized protein YlxP (DUF503 family)